MKRYLNKTLLFQDPQVQQELQEFFEAVSKAYLDFDSDRVLNERTQDLATREIDAERLRAELKSRQLEEVNASLIATQAMLVNSSKMAALGEMAGGVAHEINNPLGVIQMRAEQMDEQLQQNEVDLAFFNKSIQSILNTSNRIAKIVSGLRTFARDGTRDPMKTALVMQLIEDSLILCAEKFKLHGIDLAIHIDENLKSQLSVVCRDIEVTQVLVNLLNNSYDAIQNLEEKWIQIHVADMGKYVELAIVDSGKGILRAIQDKMMQPFFTTKEVGKGTGLGLSISKGIIEVHNGEISVDNNSPNTRIVLLLPKQQTEYSKLAA